MYCELFLFTWMFCQGLQNDSTCWNPVSSSYNTSRVWFVSTWSLHAHLPILLCFKKNTVKTFQKVSHWGLPRVWRNFQEYKETKCVLAFPKYLDIELQITWLPSTPLEVKSVLQSSEKKVPETNCCPLMPMGMIPRLFMAVAQAPWSLTGTLKWFSPGLPTPSAGIPQESKKKDIGDKRSLMWGGGCLYWNVG